MGSRSIPIFEDRALREINGGDLEDLYWEEVIENHKQIFEMFRSTPHLISLPNGETITQLQDRVKNKILDIVDTNKDRQICVTSHGMAIRTFLCFVKGVNLSQMTEMNFYKNTGVSIMDFTDNKINLVLENDSSHLDVL